MVERGEIYWDNLDPKSGTEINKVEHPVYFSTD